MRVLLLYVPFFWSFRTHLYGWVTPAWALFLMGTMAYIGWALSTWPEFVTLLIAAGLVGTGIGALLASWYELAPKMVKKILIYLISPIWYPGKLLGQLLVWLWGAGLDKAIEWFFLHHLTTTGWARPWMVAAEVLLTLSPLVFGLEAVAKAVFSVALTVLLIGGFFIAFAAIVEGGKYLKNHWPREETGQAKPKGASTLQLAGQYILARKRRICPLINLPESRLSVIRE